MLAHARGLAASGQDEVAKRAYLDILRADPEHLPALLELGALARASGHTSAEQTAYQQAVRHHPSSTVARVALGNLLLEAGDPAAAEPHYRAALCIDPDYAPAHQGLARVCSEQGDPAAAWRHGRLGFQGRTVVSRRYRGAGTGVPLLLLVSAFGGNIPTRSWIDDRIFSVTALYAEFHDPAAPLPPHVLVVNAIGDADLCGAGLTAAGAILAGTAAPVINLPDRVRATTRVACAQALAGIPNVVTADTQRLTRTALLARRDWTFPLLLRTPGFHTGRHFVRVDSEAGLANAAAGLPGDELLAISYLNSRGPDGLARKYRVMFIDGACYPVHLAVSADWKVHYFTADMAGNPAHRREEERFLTAMKPALGGKAVAALSAVRERLDLDYGGIDFGMDLDGSVLLFEANATMAIVPPDADSVWDYRRPAIAAVRAAAGRMLQRRAAQLPGRSCDSAKNRSFQLAG